MLLEPLPRHKLSHLLGQVTTPSLERDMLYGRPVGSTVRNGMHVRVMGVHFTDSIEGSKLSETDLHPLKTILLLNYTFTRQIWQQHNSESV